MHLTSVAACLALHAITATADHAPSFGDDILQRRAAESAPASMDEPDVSQLAQARQLRRRTLTKQSKVLVGKFQNAFLATKYPDDEDRRQKRIAAWHQARSQDVTRKRQQKQSGEREGFKPKLAFAAGEGRGESAILQDEQPLERHGGDEPSRPKSILAKENTHAEKHISPDKGPMEREENGEAKWSEDSQKSLPPYLWPFSREQSVNDLAAADGSRGGSRQTSMSLMQGSRQPSTSRKHEEKL